MSERSCCSAGRSAIGRRLHRGADLALAFADDLDERLTVERQHYCPPQFGVVEGRDRAVDDRGTAGILRRSRLFGQLSGRNKLNAGSRLLV
jgi:hypothetical protein